jgi:hypothetical protein
MISIVGLGNAASAIAQCFENTPQYNVYKLNSSIKRNSKNNFKLIAFENPEDYEENIPDLTKFFADINNHIQFSRCYLHQARHRATYWFACFD